MQCNKGYARKIEMMRNQFAILPKRYAIFVIANATPKNGNVCIFLTVGLNWFGLRLQWFAKITLIVLQNALTFFGNYIAVDSSDLSPPNRDELKDGQWLGVNVKSQGGNGKVVVSWQI